MKITKEIRKYLKAIGRQGGLIGGKSTSEKKRQAVKVNVSKAAKVSGENRRKYPPCPHYSKLKDKHGKPYRGHRFDKKYGQCACGLTK